jgi:poly-gamma-glutamate synthesis protein (capsule biosynthesis protein)
VSKPIDILMVGDIILDEPNPGPLFDPSRATLTAADLVIGHVEVPHTRRGSEQSTDIPAPPAAASHSHHASSPFDSHSHHN